MPERENSHKSVTDYLEGDITVQNDSDCWLGPWIDGRDVNRSTGKAANVFHPLPGATK